MDTQFQVSASVHDARIWFSVFGTDLSVMPYEDNQIITDAQASATFRGQTIPLRFGPGSPVPGNFGAVDLESDVTADEPVAFTLTHGGATSTVMNTMPADFALATPTDAIVGAPVDLTWSPTSSDVMSWSGDCDGEGFDGPVPTDTGALEFPPVVFGCFPSGGNVELTMTRSRTTTPESAFRIMSYATERQHTIDFRVTP